MGASVRYVRVFSPEHIVFFIFIAIFHPTVKRSVSEVTFYQLTTFKEDVLAVRTFVYLAHR